MRLRFVLLSGLLAALASGWPTPAAAQAPVGDGLRGDYYAGRDFERYVTSRRDAALDFDWQRQPPLPGVPAEYFSVRWTGWLLPPTTGEYVLRVAVDDGARLWLNNQLLLDEWRGQQVSFFQVKVKLRAGHPYRLRFDYCQYGWDTRLLLNWRPPTTTPPPNPRGLPDDGTFGAPIPTRYLFSYNPAPPRPAVVAPAAAAPPPRSRSTTIATSLAWRRSTAAAAPSPRPMPTVALAPVAVRARPVRQRPAREAAAPPTPTRTATLGEQLASGRALTLRTLYFEQGQAGLLPPVQASLDTLAEALRQRPALRLQVQGHTDNQSDSLLNRQLSQRRAEVVCAYLAAHGVGAARLHPVGLGGRYPVADNRVPAERPRNRRVVLVRE